MAGKSVTCDRGRTLRTYGRLQPLRRVKPQHWLSPAEAKHLFSSSSSSSCSLLSSSCEPSSNGDSDFKPTRKKKRVMCKGRKVVKRPAVKIRKKDTKSESKIQPESYSARTSNGLEGETGPSLKRNPTASLVLSTPFRRFVTVRRKALPSNVMKTQGSRPAKERFIQPSDSTYDFQTCGPSSQKERRLCKPIRNILDSSAEILHSPLHNSPLLSSTPSVAVLPRLKARDTLTRLLDLRDNLEESAIVSFAEPNAKDSLISEHLKVRKLDTCRKTHLLSVHKESNTERDTSASSEIKRRASKSRRHSKSMRLEFAHEDNTSRKPTSILNDSKIKQCRRSSSSLPFFPLSHSSAMPSSCQSQSLICLEEPLTPCNSQNHDSVVCISSDLFSNMDSEHESLEANDKDLPEDTWVPCKTPVKNVQRALTLVLFDSPYADKETFLPLKHLQSKNYQAKNRVSTSPQRCINPARSPPWEADTLENAQQLEANTCRDTLQSNTGIIYLTDKGLCLKKMQPVVLLDSNIVAKHFVSKNAVSPSLNTEAVIQGSGSTPPVDTIARTPVLPDSRVKNKILSSTATQEAVGTGRKVCISGFSVNRWGTRQKKRKRIPDLSFRKHDIPVLRFREDTTSCSALSSSLLYSTSLFTSSFMNSSTAMNLSLTPDEVPDPQKEHQRWLRLRAALSLHRKKKAMLSNRVEDKDIRLELHTPCSVNSTRVSQHSSLFLLSPRHSSCEELSDADKVFMECDQDGPISFLHCLNKTELRLCQKVGEGVYGEVFKTIRRGKHVALKVIPIEGNRKVNGEDQKSFGEILPEIIISKELSLLSEGVKNKTSGFISLHSAHCVQGSYPADLLTAWDIYAEDKGTENERPDFFSLQQLFMILEFEFGGNDLECMSSQLPSVSVSRSILHQVTTALAVAEEELRFEHRDLHWGNLLIENCDAHTLTYSLDGETMTIPTSGVQVKIIDYTLSRLDKDGLTVFTDLSADEELFLGEGDLQFTVYREMKQENMNMWSSYNPYSNVLWLHYLADKLLSAVKYVRKPSSVVHRRELRKLQDFRREVRKFCSATEALRMSKLFK